MSTPACVSCQESLSCSDSPLSVTANIIGILTFTGALMISTHVYFDKMINAERNILEMMSMLEMKFGDFQHLAAKLEIELRRGFGGGELDHRVIAALRGAERSLDETHRLLDRLRPDSYDRGNRLWLRAKFMQREEMIRGAMAKMETGMTTLREVANDIFSSIVPEPTEHEALFRSQVVEMLTDLRFSNRVLTDHESTPMDGGLPDYDEAHNHNQLRNSNPIPEPTEHEIAFRGEVLQDLMEVRNEMRNLKETNARVSREMQDVLQEALSRLVPKSA